MRLPSRRSAHFAGVIAAVIAMVGTGTAVTAASYSVFNSTTSNATSNWTAGSVALTNDSSAALFTVTGMKPGSTGSNCITVTSTGSLPSTVKLYATASSVTGTLAPYVDLTIQAGTGGGFGNCTGWTAGSTAAWSGTLTAFSALTGFSNGYVTGWTPTGTASESRVFKITYTLDTAVPNTLQSATAGGGITWEAQNN